MVPQTGRRRRPVPLTPASTLLPEKPGASVGWTPAAKGSAVRKLAITLTVLASISVAGCGDDAPTTTSAEGPEGVIATTSTTVTGSTLLTTTTRLRTTTTADTTTTRTTTTPPGREGVI